MITRLRFKGNFIKFKSNIISIIEKIFGLTSEDGLFLTDENDKIITLD